MSNIKYLTLSHRWGARPALTLTKSKISLWSSNIPLEDLPQTYRDAVAATTRLGFEYFWIDALCIIQDSKEDWYREASAMLDVYINSICNLSALHAQDDSDGMFSTRIPEENFPIVSALTSEKRPQRLLHIESSDYWDHHITRKELNRRGWVVQGRLLAPRILHFGKTQLFWECRKLYAWESLPGGIPNETMWPNLRSRVRARKQKEEDYEDYYDPTRRTWEAVVAMYSASDLTVSSDKLVAISGVAKVFGTASRDDYCAGLWKSIFIPQLTWRIKAGGGIRPNSYRAPSWSWASVDGQVKFEQSVSSLSHNLAFAESVEVTTVTDDAFGAVKDGFLKLRGQLYPTVRGNDQEYRHLASKIIRLACLPDGLVLNKIYPDSKHDPTSDTLCCMPIRCLDHGETAFFMSLMLKPSDRDGMYERVGLMTTWCYPNGYFQHTRTHYSDSQSNQQENNDRYPEQIITVV